MYVAMTRARQRLYLTRAESRMLHGQVRYGLRSRFLDEVPPALCRWLSGAAFQKAPRFDAEPVPFRPPAGGQTGPSSARPPFAIGQSVVHAKFGSGVVLKCEGSGSDARVQVNFRDAGVKWLALAFARLNSADF